MGVIALRVSTESIMRDLCKRNGVTWKTNARPTLKNYIHSLNQKIEIDSKIMSKLDSILSLGNRAAHSFNLDSEEFLEVLKKFCDIVDWYSELM